MHYKNATYDALVQQWANAVRLMRRSVRCAASGERGEQRRARLGWTSACEPPVAAHGALRELVDSWLASR
jgi:hypothetical protein